MHFIIDVDFYGRYDATRLTSKERDRGIAQSGSAPALGAGCRGFESLYPDQYKLRACSSIG
jgi:hypothetical protein